jgi:hypothetical protein
MKRVGDPFEKEFEKIHRLEQIDVAARNSVSRENGRYVTMDEMLAQRGADLFSQINKSISFAAPFLTIVDNISRSISIETRFMYTPVGNIGSNDYKMINQVTQWSGQATFEGEKTPRTICMKRSFAIGYENVVIDPADYAVYDAYDDNFPVSYDPSRLIPVWRQIGSSWDFYDSDLNRTEEYFHINGSGLYPNEPHPSHLQNPKKLSLFQYYVLFSRFGIHLKHIVALCKYLLAQPWKLPSSSEDALVLEWLSCFPNKEVKESFHDQVFFVRNSRLAVSSKALAMWANGNLKAVYSFPARYAYPVPFDINEEEEEEQEEDIGKVLELLVESHFDVHKSPKHPIFSEAPMKEPQRREDEVSERDAIEKKVSNNHNNNNNASVLVGGTDEGLTHAQMRENLRLEREAADSSYEEQAERELNRSARLGQ